MAGIEDNTTIVVKKIVKGGDGHHGGAWKVAYADFVTAMMAFFLLLWLLNVTTSEQRSGIADYFSPTAASKSTSGSGQILGGQALAKHGSRKSELSPPSATFSLTPPDAKSDENPEATREDDSAHQDSEPSEVKPVEATDAPVTDTAEASPNDTPETDTPREPTEEDIAHKFARHEQERFEQAERELRQAIQDVPELAGFARNLIIDNTPEGLRIQIVDQDRESMFPSGSADMHDQMAVLINKIAEVVARVPNRISITGHTDATPYRSTNGYGNWELSADRANASRRALLRAGVSPARIAYVTGKADTEPLIKEDPKLPANRRISIVLLRESGEPGFGSPR